MAANKLPFVPTSFVGSGNEFTDGKFGRVNAMAYLDFAAANEDVSIFSTIFLHMQWVGQGANILEFPSRKRIAPARVVMGGAATNS